jgi:hypothetical protein
VVGVWIGRPDNPAIAVLFGLVGAFVVFIIGYIRDLHAGASQEVTFLSPQQVTRRLIGYWKAVGLDPESERWPDPSWFVDTHWDEQERRAVSMYLKRGEGFTAFGGPSWCRFCDSDVGSIEVTDGVFDWPEGLVHYVDEHGVRLPAEFVRHILDGGSQPPEDLTEEHMGFRNTTWWANQRGWGQTGESPHLTPGQWVFAPWEWASHRLGRLVIGDDAGMGCAGWALCAIVEEIARVLKTQGAEALSRWLMDEAGPVYRDKFLDVRQLTPANQEAFRSAIPLAVAAYRARGPGELDEISWQGYVKLFDNLADQVALLSRGEKPSNLPNLAGTRKHDGTRSGPGWDDEQQTPAIEDT